jgi:hypothetical protein
LVGARVADKVGACVDGARLGSLDRLRLVGAGVEMGCLVGVCVGAREGGFVLATVGVLVGALVGGEVTLRDLVGAPVVTFLLVGAWECAAGIVDGAEIGGKVGTGTG